MLDIKLIRANPEFVKSALSKRGKCYDEEIDELLSIDVKRRELSAAIDKIKFEQNTANKEIVNLKAAGQNTDEVLQQMKVLAQKSKEFSAAILDLDKRYQELMYLLPNVPHSSVPEGKDETENKEVRRWGEPKKFDFEPKAHWELGKSLNILDSERASKVTGTRFVYYKNLGARLERAIINFFLDTHTANGYSELLPPFIVNKDSMYGTGQLPKFKEDMFKLEDLNYYLISTAEIPLTNYYREEILKKDQLPAKFCAYSACFRGEAGSAGRDTRGIIRQHQFNKVELVKFASPENSYDELESLTCDAERVLQLLELPYRVIVLCTGDMGFCSAKTYDIEVWLPSYNRYVEISSCSNMEDFQARRAQIKYKENAQEKAKFVHTLNGSGLAVGRTFAAILENFQNKDGSINIPKVLHKYMGCDKIK
ncbi:MAG: serine--tRNA ligase [Oscillospiraceae bacterium]|nr:serine--tRNA ligase [Oscillospiraceae bacterium]